MPCEESQFFSPTRKIDCGLDCGIPVLFPLSMRCQLPSYNIVGSHFNHRLTVVNSIKRTARIKNWLFDPNSWTKQNTNTAESIFRITAARCLNYHDRCLCYLPNNIHDKITAF